MDSRILCWSKEERQERQSFQKVDEEGEHMAEFVEGEATTHTSPFLDETKHERRALNARHDARRVRRCNEGLGLTTYSSSTSG